MCIEKTTRTKVIPTSDKVMGLIASWTNYIYMYKYIFILLLFLHYTRIIICCIISSITYFRYNVYNSRLKKQMIEHYKTN